METTMNTMPPDTAIPRDDAQQNSTASRPANRRFGRSGDDVVRWGEFQLALWMGAFTLTAVLGGFTFLYTAVTDLRVAISDLRVEMEVQHAEMRDELRADMETQLVGIRAEIANLSVEIVNLRERVIKIETRLDAATGLSNDPAA